MQLFKPYAYIPLVLSLNEVRNRYAYEAVVTTEVRVAPVEDVVNFIKENPDVLLNLTTRLSRAVSGLLQKITLTAFNNAYTRTLSLLIYLGVRFGEKRGDECVITLPLSHQDIAGFLGIQRETISRKMSELKEVGIIRYEDEHIVLTNVSAAKRELEASKNRI